MCFIWKVRFNPENDTIKKPDGGEFKFDTPYEMNYQSKGFSSGEILSILLLMELNYLF